MTFARLRISEVTSSGMTWNIFAAVYVVEGVGLWRCRRWAEYLTIGVSASFLPFELLAIFHHPTMPLLITFVLNVLVVAFLAWQVRVAKPHPGRD